MKTDEGARVVRAHLADGGAYLANVRSACEGRRSATLREVREAFGREFASCPRGSGVGGRAGEARKQRVYSQVDGLGANQRPGHDLNSAVPI